MDSIEPGSAIKKYRTLPEGVNCEVIYDNIVNTARANTNDVRLQRQ